MNPTEILDMLVSDVLIARPDAARVFLDRHMGCVGCTFAPFETVAEVAHVYGIDPCELAASIADAAAPNPPEGLIQ